MNLSFQLSKRVCCFIIIIQTTYSHMYAQQWVWDEISKEDDGSVPVGGVVGAAILFGLIWLLATVFGDENKANSQSDFHDESIEPPCPDFDEEDNCDPMMFDDDNEDSMGMSHQSLSQNISFSSSVSASTILSNSAQKSDDDIDFQRKCIDIYGEYAENTYGLVLVKEDGEYRQIAYPDKRYEVLSSFLYQNHKERHAMVCTIGNGYLLEFYIECEKNNVFPVAKPMEDHGKLEKEFLGERIAMMKAYYWQKKCPIYVDNGYSLRDYCLLLGWELCIYIHKYICRPMDIREYHDLKDMTLRNMTMKEYIEYRSKADYISERNEEWFDGWGNYIGKSYGEASAELDKRKVFTYEQAIAEVKQIDWSLKPSDTIQKMKLVAK